MSDKKLLLIGPAPPKTGASLVNQVLRLCPDTFRPKIQSLTFDQVIENASLVQGPAVAWVIVDSEEAAGLFELIGYLQDHHVPSMLTRPRDRHPLGASFMEGVVVAPPESPPQSLAAILGSLWSLADVLAAMKMEMAILRLQHGGMVNQFGKLDSELRMAAELQRDLLPASMPDVDGLDFSVLFRPVGYVSGDIYDVARVDEDHISFFMADAVGHGVPAALLTVLIKSLLSVRHFEHSGDDSPGPGLIAPHESLTRLNRHIVRQSSESVHTATAVFGLLNIKTHEVDIARAGHPYPLLFRSDGSATPVGPAGALLGVFEDEQYEVQRIKLEVGDRLVLYSDGFETAFPDPRPSHDDRSAARPLVATDRYLEAFHDIAAVPIDEAVNQLSRRLDAQAGSLNQHDDLTILMIGVNKPAQMQVADEQVLAA